MTIAVAALITVALGVVPGSLALWNDAASVDAGSVDAGRLGAAIAPGTDTPTTDTAVALPTLTAMLPGESRTATFTVRSTGTVPIQVAAARSAAMSEYLLLEMHSGVCSAVPQPYTQLSASPANVGSPVSPDTDRSFCLRVTLDENAPAEMAGTGIGPYGVELFARVR